MLHLPNQEGRGFRYSSVQIVRNGEVCSHMESKPEEKGANWPQGHIPGNVFTREQIIEDRKRLGYFDDNGTRQYGLPPNWIALGIK